MHRLEKQALDDPFLWEALEGYAHTSNPGTELSILQRQLHERIVHLQENKKVFDFTWQRLSVAASAAVLFITAGILFWMNINRSGPIAHKQVEVAIIDRDSLKSEIHGSGTQAVIREKKTPVSSDETRITAYKPAEVIKDEPQVKAVSSSAIKELPSAVASARVAKVRIEDQAPDARTQASSAGISASEQGVQPLAGWDIYRKYLEDNIRRPAGEPKINGSVLLSFEVDKSGKPSNFNVLKGLTDACNTEAIRLVKDGPAWKTRIGSKISTARVEVVF